MPLDKVAPSYAFDEQMHNRRRYPYIYYCSGCVRSYFSKAKEESCKFCTGPIKLVTGGKRYIYFCENCDTRIESDEPKVACSTCGRRILTLYRWDMLNKKEKRRIKFARLLKHFYSIRPRVKVKEMKGKSDPVALAKGPKVRKKKARGREELPTN